MASIKGASLASAGQYKAAKEAFHANNVGSSIMNINVLSLTALVSCDFEVDPARLQSLHVDCLRHLRRNNRQAPVIPHLRLRHDRPPASSGRHAVRYSAIHLQRGLDMYLRTTLQPYSAGDPRKAVRRRPDSTVYRPSQVQGQMAGGIGFGRRTFSARYDLRPYFSCGGHASFRGDIGQLDRYLAGSLG
jgi:hypothetical protein